MSDTPGHHRHVQHETVLGHFDELILDWAILLEALQGHPDYQACVLAVERLNCTYDERCRRAYFKGRTDQYDALQSDLDALRRQVSEYQTLLDPSTNLTPQ